MEAHEGADGQLKLLSSIYTPIPVSQYLAVIKRPAQGTWAFVKSFFVASSLFPIFRCFIACHRADSGCCVVLCCVVCVYGGGTGVSQKARQGCTQHPSVCTIEFLLFFRICRGGAEWKENIISSSKTRKNKVYPYYAFLNPFSLSLPLSTPM
jgi:hypothetical protein